MKFNEVKLKYIAHLNPSKSEMDLGGNKEQVVSFIPMDKIISSNNLDLSLNKTIEEVYSGYTYFRENDIVLAKVTPCFENGNLAIARGLTNKIGFGTTELHVLRVNEKFYDTEYIYYCLQLKDFKSEAVANMYGVGGLKRIPTEFLSEYKFLVPNLDTQIRIREYLNLILNEISNLIGNKTKLIKLLEQQCHSIITEAVTKGLNPNVKMKDSGVEWIGEVPEHWLFTRLDFVSRVKARLGWKGLKAEEYVEDGYAFLATPNLKERNIDFINVNYITEERYLESPEIMLEVGDVLLAKDGSTLGIVNVVRSLPKNATVNSSIAVIRPTEKIDSVYFYYYLKSTYIQDVINQIKDGMGVPHLFQADIKKFKVLLPPIDEQIVIAKYLDEETLILEQLVGKVTQQIEALKEYRQSLIYEAVTGKIDVRDMKLDCVR